MFSPPLKQRKKNLRSPTCATIPLYLYNKLLAISITKVRVPFFIVNPITLYEQQHHQS